MTLSYPATWPPLLLAFVVAPLLALGVLALAHRVLERLLRGRDAPVLLALLRRGRRPLRLTVVLLVLDLALPAAGLEEATAGWADSLLGLAVAVALGWTITRKVAAAFDVQLEGAQPSDEDLVQRRRRTQLAVFRRLAVSAGVVFTVGVVLTAIPAVRAVGLSLFASAGVAGIVIGIAARPAVSNLIAGLQIALTQPIRIGDAVTVEGQWGRVQEITSTYVTIQTWDQRSLVVPLSHFLEKPFLNWTKDSAELIDTVFLYLDHAAPVQVIREQVAALVAEAPQWDGRVAKVNVTAIKETCIELRVLLSAADAGRMFELRCLVREALLAWLAREHPEALPRQRQEDIESN
jgi:small-conductance mechanosensitive channel